MERKGIIAAMALGGVAVAAAALALWRRYGSGTYLRFDTMFGTARVYQVEDDDGEPVRLLEVGGIVQSGTYLEERYTELVFEYLRKYDVLFDLVPKPERICVLGCGGYDYPEHLVASCDATVDAVEIDPAITAIARRYFYLDRLIEEYETERTGRLNLVCADALDHLLATGHLYDAVVNDAFDAGEPPSHLTTERFARAIRSRLKPGGAYLVNVVSALEGRNAQFLRDQMEVLGRVFGHVCALPCAEEEIARVERDNVVVVASDSPLDALPDAAMRRSARFPKA